VLAYQVIEIALYPELCGIKWVGSSANATADWWYKCDENGTRNANGLYMRVEDGGGMFYRGAGANAVKTAMPGRPYNGGEIGEFKGNVIRDHRHVQRATDVSIPSGNMYIAAIRSSYANTSEMSETSYMVEGYSDRYETAPASVAALVCMGFKPFL
jgi:hypothetical protein